MRGPARPGWCWPRVAVDGRSNEITAIPELLALLDLNGAVVTPDAMGCQKAVVEAICDRGAHYVTVKGDQLGLDDAIGSFFQDALDREFACIPYRYQRTTGRGHGPGETRHYSIVAAPEAVRAQPGWRDLRSIGMVFAERRGRAAVPTAEAGFFIANLPPEARRSARAARATGRSKKGCTERSTCSSARTRAGS